MSHRASHKEGGEPTNPDLAALQSGELSIDEYVERRLEAQIEKFGKRLSPEKLEEVRGLLRRHFLDDPLVLEYARRAAGRKE